MVHCCVTAGLVLASHADSSTRSPAETEHRIRSCTCVLTIFKQNLKVEMSLRDTVHVIVTTLKEYTDLCLRSAPSVYHLMTNLKASTRTQDRWLLSPDMTCTYDKQPLCNTMLDCCFTLLQVALFSVTLT